MVFSVFMRKSSKPELILGIRNLAGLEACSSYADAVYFSTDRLSLRAKAKEITLETLDEFVSEVKARGLRAYLAVNSAVNERQARGCIGCNNCSFKCRSRCSYRLGSGCNSEGAESRASNSYLYAGKRYKP